MKAVTLKEGTPLKVWETLEILVGDEQNPGRYRARIEDFINGGIVITAPVFIDGKSLLRNGSNVLVNITRDDAAYQFSSRIRQSHRSGGSSILTPPQNIRRVQRRLFCRVESSEKLEYAFIQPTMEWDDYDEKLTWHESISHDISGGGMLISVREKPSVEQLLLVRVFSFPHQDLPGMLVAICRRAFQKERRWLAGIEFLTAQRLPKHFTQAEIKRLPAETKKFDNSAQDHLVQLVFNRQIELRNKGLL